MALPLGLDVHHEGQRVRVVVRGELDASTAPALESLLASLGPSGEVILDLSGLEFADSHGLAPVARHAGLVLERPTRPVRRLLRVLNLTFSTTPGVVEKVAVV